jgi:glucosamine--fructose-6-phosphate aminotransferase (isomerizing)
MNNTIMFKEINEQIYCTERSYTYNLDNIKKLAATINNFKPQNVVIVGRGTSMHAGIFAKHLLELYYHIPVSIASQSIYTIYDSYTDLSKSLVIAISQSGGGKDNLAVIEKAKEKGALTVGIVNELESDLAKSCEHILYCNADKAVAPAATKTFTSTIHLITMLVYELTKNEILNVSVKEIQKAITDGIEKHELIKCKINSLIPAKDILTLGRGLSLSLAMETGLKIKETCHTNVNTYPLSEFQHGSIISANKDMPAIMFDFEKETRNDVKKIFERLQHKDVPVLLITNDTEFANGKNHILLHSNNPICAYFEATVIIQILSCALSLSKGYSPDYYPKAEHVETF